MARTICGGCRETFTDLKGAGFWKARDLRPRKNWRESTGSALAAMCDPHGRGGVARGLWEWRA